MKVVRDLISGEKLYYRPSLLIIGSLTDLESYRFNDYGRRYLAPNNVNNSVWPVWEPGPHIPTFSWVLFGLDS